MATFGFLDEQQKVVFKAVMNSLCEKNARMFLVEGPAGTGKSYLLRAIYEQARTDGFRVETTAGSAVSAVGIGGVTVHSLFYLTRNTPPDTSGVRSESDRGARLINTDLFLWDEVSSNSAAHIREADRLMRSLPGAQDGPFGGKVVVFAGDLRGLLPPGTSPSNYAFSWEYWPLVRKYTLTENHKFDPNYSEELLAIGSGGYDFRAPESRVTQFIAEVDSEMVVETLDALVSETFSECFDEHSPQETFGRVILTRTNDLSLRLNTLILNKLPGGDPVIIEGSTGYFLGGNIGEHDRAAFEGETPFGLPPHRLVLKVGAEVVLLKNLHPESGLSNGTILTVNQIGPDHLVCTIRNGPYAGSTRLIPKDQEFFTHNEMPAFRTQFPVRLAYAMTIHKAQGKTFKKVGLYVDQNYFCHGQLYTALSRVACKNDIKIFLEEAVHRDTFDEYSGKFSLGNRVQECFFNQAKAVGGQLE